MSTWSAGQREFTIEEPEMGLHPKAIGSFMGIANDQGIPDILTPLCLLFGTTKSRGYSSSEKA